MNQYKAQLAAVRQQFAKNQAQQNQLQQEILQLQASLAELENVVTLGKALRTEAQLHFRVLLKWDNSEVVLVTSEESDQTPVW